ncbi:MAG: hypothetical protein ACI89X_000770 [Planctomycetota bacterium]|jgi:hypothetical protein
MKKLVVVLALVGCGRAQSLSGLRQQLRGDLRDLHFAQSLIGLVLTSNELELGGGSYSINDTASTDLQTFAMPVHTRVELAGRDAPQLYLEASLGYAEAKQRLGDIYGGAAPGIETSVHSRWRTFGALVGAGLEYELADGLTLAPIVNAAVSRIDNRTDYGGPGSNVTAAIADGIAFNWDATALTYGVATRIEWQRELGNELRLDLVARYDVRWTETIEEDDAAQDFVARSQLLTLRGDLFGPTGMAVFGAQLDWQATVAYRVLPEATLFGVRDYVEVGGSLLARYGDLLPAGSGVAFSAAAFFGEDFAGWTVGMRMLF